MRFVLFQKYPLLVRGIFVSLGDPHGNDRDLLVEVRVVMRASLHPLDSLEPVDDTCEARVGVVVALSAGAVQFGVVIHVDVEIRRGWTSGKAQRPFTVGEVLRIFLEHRSRERRMDEPVVEVDTRWSCDGVRFRTSHQDVRCVPVERRPIIMLHGYLVQEPVHGMWEFFDWCHLEGELAILVIVIVELREVRCKLQEDFDSVRTRTILLGHSQFGHLLDTLLQLFDLCMVCR
mmetsp:Transcript_29650/g.71743  ORF Transcript_29650/g.71743 Transcript_29650/m.71743 type:complete len:232 (+) Transcript_29650:2633-3328(+)